jgi:DNA-binding MarR family transcriptional regulator
MGAPRQLHQTLHEFGQVILHRSFHDMMRFARGEGLSMGQMGALMRLGKEGMCGVSDIGAQMGVTSAAASQMIDRLVQMGLIERTEDPNDRRVKLITLTAKGRALLHRSLEARRQWIESLGSHLDPERQAAVIAALGYLIEAAHKAETEAEA